MRTLGSSPGTIALMSCLIGPILGCNPDTFGFGEADAEAGQSDGFDADLGEDSMDAGEDADESGGPNGEDQGGEDDNGDDDNGGEDGGDGDGEDGGDGEGADSCLNPLGPALSIELDGVSQECEDLEFTATVTKIDAGAYALTTCDCGDPNCDGDELLLSLTVPDPEWLPKLEVDGCYQFDVFAEPVTSGVCRRNRLDIFTQTHGVIWYSTGSARENLSHNGFNLHPVFHSTCVDQCGEWELRDLTFTVDKGGMTLAQGKSDAVGAYEVMNWHSYRAPVGCKSPIAETSAWTARYIE